MQADVTAALRARTDGKLWLTDGGIETVMIFLEGLDLPHFASFPLLNSARGRDRLAAYFNGFMDEAAAQGTGFILDTVTWRASRGWGAVMALSARQIDDANRAAVAFAKELRAARKDGGAEVIVNGLIGPHGDAYAPDRILTASEAQDYHRPQIAVLAEAGVEMISALTLSTPAEAIGIAKAARAENLPAVLSFTVETDGRLTTGMTIDAAITQTDAATDGYPAWYMINCAHPDHFRHRLAGDWVARIGGVRANSSRLSHAELDEAVTLDAGDPQELAQDYHALQALLPGLRVLGGCCGTDLRHIAAIGGACIGHHSRAAS